MTDPLLSEPEHSTNILHLSDLHIQEKTDTESMAYDIRRDLESNFPGLDVHILAVTGDVAETGAKAEHEKGLAFLETISTDLRIGKDRILLVPGNHDEDRRVYSSNSGAFYHLRFRNFSECLMKPFLGREYSNDHADQFNLVVHAESQVLFMGLNSAWQTDADHENRTSIHETAFTRALKAVADTIKRFDDPIGHWLKIAAWHHPFYGRASIERKGVIEKLTRDGFQLCLHGHAHDLNVDEIKQVWDKHPVWCFGAGALASHPEARPDSVPRLYSIIKLFRRQEEDVIELYVRAQMSRPGVWSDFAVWPTDKPFHRRSYQTYVIPKPTWKR